MQNLFLILNIPTTASADDARRAFVRLAKIYHPDKVGGSAEKFKEISAAYESVKKYIAERSAPFQQYVYVNYGNGSGYGFYYTSI
jgi:DnaJ-class molecular chaperone